MNHPNEASKGTGASHIRPQLGKNLVEYCVAGFSGWVCEGALDSSFRLNSPTLSSDDRSRPTGEGKQAQIRAARERHVCNMCGKPSESTICETCSERIRIEALARKKHEEDGCAWTHWYLPRQLHH